MKRATTSVLFSTLVALVYLHILQSNNFGENSLLAVSICNCTHARLLDSSVLAIVILSVRRLSVCLSVTTRYRFKHSSPGKIEIPGFHHYHSLWYRILVSYEQIWCRWVRRFSSNEGIKQEYPSKRS